MEPLAAFSPVPAHGQVFPAPLTPQGDRDAARMRPSGQLRPVELAPDRVDAGDTTHAVRPPTSHHSEAEPGATPLLGSRSLGGGAGGDEAPIQQPDLGAAGVQAHNHGVTYKVYPDLAIRFQGRVVDRATTEVVREVPDQRRIEIARRYQQYIGTRVDLRA